MTFSYKDLKQFKKYIMKNLKIKNNYKLKLLPKYDTLEYLIDDREYGYAFAAVNPIERIILLPLALMCKGHACNIYGSMAHELIHVWQYENKKDLSEDEAEEKAEILLKNYFNISVIKAY